MSITIWLSDATVTEETTSPVSGAPFQVILLVSTSVAEFEEPLSSTVKNPAPSSVRRVFV